MNITNIFKKKKEPTEKEKLIEFRIALTESYFAEYNNMDADERSKLIKDICLVNEQITRYQELEDNKKSKRSDRLVNAGLRATEIGLGVAVPVYLIGKEHQFEQMGDYMTSQTARSTLNKVFDTFKYVNRH